MQFSAVPRKITVPFADNGAKTDIPVQSQTGITAGAASFVDGFPPLTRTPLSAGGVPPFGQDFNGILYLVSAWSRWSAAGAPIYYDAAFASAIGGYPRGATLQSVVAGQSWVSTVDNNTTNPDGGGANWLQLGNGRLLSVRQFTASGTYTPSAGTNRIRVFCQGGGGASGGTPVTNSSQNAASPGAAGGAFGWKWISTGFSGAVMTVGAGGQPVSGSSGGNGAATSFGAFLTAPGGSGSSVGVATSVNAAQGGTNGAAIASGGDFNIGGQSGTGAIIFVGISVIGGNGGSSPFGSGGLGGTQVGSAVAATAGSGYGVGGGGIAVPGSAAATGGQNGQQGLIIVEEYA